MTTDTRSCDCQRPWPDMVRLGAPGLSRFYLCAKCGIIRVEVASTPGGTLDAVRFVAADDVTLPAAVRDQAAEILTRGRGKQGRLL